MKKENENWGAIGKGAYLHTGFRCGDGSPMRCGAESILMNYFLRMMG